MVIVIGVGIVVYDQLFVPEPGTYLFVAVEPTREAEIGSNAPTVEYSDRSPSVQRKFTQRFNGQTTYLGSEANARDAFPWKLNEIGYVHYRGDHYETGSSRGIHRPFRGQRSCSSVAS